MLRQCALLTIVAYLSLSSACGTQPVTLDEAHAELGSHASARVRHAHDGGRPPSEASPAWGGRRGRPGRCSPDAAQALAPADPCLFGEQFSDLRAHPELELLDERWLRAEADLDGAVEGEQLILAVQQSSHVDVATVAAALARVDQQEVRRLVIVDRTSGRAFKVLEYGAGDNSYGAIFPLDGVDLLARIHDGDLLDCKQ